MISDGQSGVGGGSAAPEGDLSTEAHRLHLTEIRAREAGLILIEIERNFLNRLQRLQALELRLHKAALARQQRPGRRVVRQIERERHRLGRELHTGVGQLLAAIRIQIEILRAKLANPPDGVREALDGISLLASSALDEVRGISRRFYAPEWQRLSLEEALRQLFQASGIPQRFAASIDISPLPREPDPDIKTLFYRAAQEAISNIVRHAGATRMDVTLGVAGDRINLRIQDNGIGFDARKTLSGPATAEGIGLRALREQAADLGGKLFVRSGPEGTTLEVSVPLSDLMTDEQ